ncbi:GAF domain-containing protein [Roseateles sp. YR242]|uniref:GAF domain-containing protein n=1 Tax=Roseateles sp. YR242 TaxID=1855305 RepID=UPI001C432E75|nr:GAF domain-containing protein [Roseateles sp. YR242]
MPDPDLAFSRSADMHPPPMTLGFAQPRLRDDLLADLSPPRAPRLRMDLPLSAMDQVPLGIARVDRLGRLTYANRTMLAISGLDDWEGVTVVDLFDGADLDAVLDGLRRRIELREGDEYEVELKRQRDNARVPISITAFPETADDGEVQGTLALVRDLTLDKATQQMVTHVENISRTKDLIDAVSAVLQPLVAFDLLQVLRLNKSRTHLRTIYPDCITEQRSYRWWHIPHAMRHLLESRAPLVINDLPAWYAEQRRQGLPPDEAIQQFLDQGYTGTLSLPVFHDNGQVASVVLCRKNWAPFDRREVNIAERLPLTEAVSVAQRNDTESDLNFLIHLIHDIAGAYDTVQRVAQTVVKRIAEHYGWDYVSIHRVDESQGKIRMIAQTAKTPGLMSELFEVDIGRGVIGSVHKTRKPALITDVATDPTYKDIFLTHRKTVTRSELCVPIGEDAHWLLNVEDEKMQAFCPEDQHSLEKVATSLEALLRRTQDYNYRKAVVDNAKDAILLVDPGNIIVDANEAAAELLRKKKTDLIGSPIGAYFHDAKRAAVVLEGDAFVNHGALMQRPGSDGALEAVQVLLSVAMLPEDNPGRVFIASDLSSFVRADELELARDLFREISGQVKTPMSLAITWLRRFAQQTASTSQDLPEKVIQQLQKAELSLDRMLMIERGGRAGPHFPTLLPLDEVITQSLSDLPERERQAVNQVSEAPQGWVRADAFELRYCVLTVVAYLLRLAATARHIDMRTWQDSDRVHLDIGGQTDALGAADFETNCRGSQAVAELALGSQTLAEIVSRNGGRFEAQRDGDHATFSFSFPRSLSGEAP